MIVFVDLLKLLSENGWSSYRLQKEHKIGNGSIIKIRTGGDISVKTINTICELCHCQPGDIMRYVSDCEQEKR